MLHQLNRRHLLLVTAALKHRPFSGLLKINAVLKLFFQLTIVLSSPALSVLLNDACWIPCLRSP